MFYQTLKGVYTHNLFETCFIVANDDLKSQTTHFTGFYTHTISEPKILKPAPSVTQRDAIEEASYLMNLAIKELADTKFEVL